MNVVIRATGLADWRALKTTRLAALLDVPTAFGASHASAAAFTDEDWQERAMSTPQRIFVLAYADGQPIGIAAHVVDGQGVFATAKLNGLDPLRWLAGVLERLPTCPNSQIDSLLPFPDFIQT